MIKLNGGLGTSMGMDRAKSLLCVRRGLSFLDIIARQVLHLRSEYDAPLPLIFMNSFRTSGDTMAALARYEDLPVEGLPLEFLQNKEPKLLAKDLAAGQLPEGPRPRVVSARPRRPLHRAARHRPARPADRRRLHAGLRLQLRQPRRGARTPGSPAGSRRPVRRSRSRRCGVPPRTARAATSPAARSTAGSCSARAPRPSTRTRTRWPTSSGTSSPRPTTCGSTWARCSEALDRRDGILGLPLIRNVKNVDPGDPKSPEVIQIETAMGAAIEVFEGSRTIEVGRDRFVPVKTTNDLLVLRSDVYDIGKDFVLDQAADAVPFVELDARLLQARRRVRQAVPRGRAVDEGGDRR